MPLHNIEITSEGITVWKAANDSEYLPFAGIIMPDSQEKANAIAAFLQDNYIDEKILLNDLPPADPARQANPAQPNWFWEGTGSPGTTYLVGRRAVLTITWTGDEYIPHLKGV